MAAGSKYKGMVLTYRTFRSIGIGRKLFVRQDVKAQAGNRWWMGAGMISSTRRLQGLIAASARTSLSVRARRGEGGRGISNRKSCTRRYGKIADVRTPRNLQRRIGLEQELKGAYLKKCDRSGSDDRAQW